MSEFTNLIRRSAETLGMTALAEKLGENYSQVHRWANGQQPKFDTAAKVIETLGGSVDRMMPEWSPPNTVKPMVKLLGRVQAGAVEFLPHDGQTRYLPIDEDLFKESALWKRSRGELFALQVYGNSMSPAFPNKTYIGVREPNVRLGEIPMGTPCIFQTGKGYTFKQLGKTEDGRLMGYPYNVTEFKAVVFDNDDIAVPYIVLGTIDLDKATA